MECDCKAQYNPQQPDTRARRTRATERHVREVSSIYEMEKTGYVYILECEGGCFYVGYSQDLQVRIASHFIGCGARWTQLHKPIAVHSIRQGDTLLETCTTIALMCKHGWEKVRGGSYCNVEMCKPPACISKALHYASYKIHPETKPPDEIG